MPTPESESEEKEPTTPVLPPVTTSAAGAASLFAGASDIFSEPEEQLFTPATPPAEPPLIIPEPNMTSITGEAVYAPPPGIDTPVVDASPPAPATPEAPATEAPAAPAPEDHTLKHGAGMRGEPDPKVIEMQTLMRDAGFGEQLGKWGPNGDGIDGRFGNDTQATVMAAQQKLKDMGHDIEVNGVYEPEKMEAALKEMAAQRQQELAAAQETPAPEAPAPEAPAPEAPEQDTQGQPEFDPSQNMSVDPNASMSADPNGLSWIANEPSWMQQPEEAVCREPENPLASLSPEAQQWARNQMEAQGVSQSTPDTEGPATNAQVVQEQQDKSAAR